MADYLSPVLLPFRDPDFTGKTLLKSSMSTKKQPAGPFDLPGIHGD
jgi:hypothetical protein